MKRFIYILAYLLSVISYSGFFVSCKDDFATDSSYHLLFSTDSLLFDTIISQTVTPTNTIVVYNTTKKDIHIDKCELVCERNCFQINFNGRVGTEFHDIDLYAGDSLFIFVQFYSEEIGVEAPLLIEADLLFSYNQNHEKLVLSAYSQDVHRIDAVTILESTVWKNDKPYLIRDSLIIEEGVALTIDPGVRLFLESNATILVKGSLVCNGTQELPISFSECRTDRLSKDMRYDLVSNQWGGIRFTESSQSNLLSNVSIRNGNFGVMVDSSVVDSLHPRLVIANSSIHNVRQCNLSLNHATLYAFNSVFSCSVSNHCMEQIGGYSLFNHCTFAGLGRGSSSFGKKVYTINIVEPSQLEELSITSARFNNCIIYGSHKDEIGFELANDLPSDALLYFFDHCLIRQVYQPSQWGDREKILLSDNHFRDVYWLDKEFYFAKQREEKISGELDYDFHLRELSEAIGKGSKEIINQYPECQIDKDGVSRITDSLPDLGAFQWIKKEEIKE